MRIEARKIGAGLCVLACMCEVARGVPNIVTDGVTPVLADSDPTTATVALATGSGVATFENFNEGDGFKPSFTDPASGIFFSNSTSTSGGFVIEYANGTNWTAPMFQDNRYMVTNGYAPGDSASLGSIFGFTGTLPQLSRSVELDVAGFGHMGAFNVTLMIQDSDGMTLGSETANFIPGLPQQFHLRADSAEINIARFLLVTEQNGFDGVDNISVTVPEPSGALAGAVGLMAALGRIVPRASQNRRASERRTQTRAARI